MNTNNIKRFAQDARKKLIEQVGAKLSYVLSADTVELREQAEQVQQLRQELNHTTKEQLVEKVAYTWFNRLMALRFMDANDYQPIGIRVITPKDGYTTPEILDEAKRGNISDELKLNRQRVFDLLDGKISSSNPQNEAFKKLLIAVCNHLNTVFPFLFEKISDYTELLLPDDLTSEFSIVTDVRDGMVIEDCIDVEIIGWLYQFYISEKKDEVFASKSTVKKEDIPAATQLFTPRWIVEYMVQNTLGKLWLQNRPKSKLREHMPYFIESATMKSDDYLRVSSPEEIKFLDPASGSGHILVYAFDLFTKIYEEDGYNTNEIPKLIIEKNLFGFEIDERASQLSGLALMMKARGYQRRALRKDIAPNILCFHDLEISGEEIKSTLNSLQIKISESLYYELLLMGQATNYGSLIVPHTNRNEIISILSAIINRNNNVDIFRKNSVDSIVVALQQLSNLALKFHCVVANPPYMGSGNMNTELSEFVKVNYPDSKADLMACFMEGGLVMLHPKGFLGMINQHSWMFLSSYENLRKKLIQGNFFDTLLHLGARTFPEIGGEVVQNAAFTFVNIPMHLNGKYIRLVNYGSSDLKREKTLEAIQNPNCGWCYTSNQQDFKKISGNPIGYWADKKIISTFSAPRLDQFCEPRHGMSTGNNEQLLRFWHEVQFGKIGLDFFSDEAFLQSGVKYVPYNKGGQRRLWYGNNFYVLRYDKYGRNMMESLFGYRIDSKAYFYKPSITWSSLSSGNIGVRICREGFVFDAKGQSAFIRNGESDILIQLAALLNSTYSTYILELLSPTLDFNSGAIRKIPTSTAIFQNENLKQLAIDCYNISIMDWDSKELSWNFKQSKLIQFKGQDLEETYDLYKHYWQEKFLKIHNNEEELNRQIISIYGLQNELSPNIKLEDITILNDELTIENETLVFKSKEVFAQFISYSVGCMFGRYSLDKEGLVLANQGETFHNYLHKIEKTENECTFLPDDDNIIPVLEDEWFDDDITGRFYQFLKVTFGENNFNKNLAFIERQIGKDIRKYFTKDFYQDHLQRYKKRPIYWMFSSPKGSFNVLIYLHRYTPDTISNILNKYLREFVGKLKTRKEHLQHVLINGTPVQKTSAIKENDSIDKMLIELHEYERDVLYPLATERITIDLDDGIMVNYNKFGKAIKEVAGLNDAKTKKKVKEFDWIDTSLIR